MLQRLLNDTSATVVIAGDLNAHCSGWCASDQDDEIGKKINGTFPSYSLEQLVDFPTHLNSMGYDACLDLVITNKLHHFQKLHSLDSLGDTDHVIISWELICLLPLKPSQRYTDSHCVPDSDIGTMIPGKYSTRAVSTAPWADINSILRSINCVPMLTNTTVDAATRQFIGTIHTVLTNTIGSLAPPQQLLQYVYRRNQSHLYGWINPYLHQSRKIVIHIVYIESILQTLITHFIKSRGTW